MDKFLLASNPLKPYSPEYVMDTINQLIFEVVYHGNRFELQMVKSLVPLFKEDNEVQASLNNAKRWYASYVAEKATKKETTDAELEHDTL